MTRLLGAAVVLAFLAGCKKGEQSEGGGPSSGSATAPIRYTIRDVNSTRSSRNQESVKKTLGMNFEQLQAWVKESPPAEERKIDTDAPGEGGPLITARNQKASVSGRDRDSVYAALEMTEEQAREWVKDAKGAREGRSVTRFLSGHVEITWRGPGGEVLYTLRNTQGSRTGKNRDGVMSTLGKTDEQIVEWVTDPVAASESRSATFARSGHVEGISRGPLLDPPWTR